MHTHKNQTGSVVIILLVILVLAIVGFGGYYVWHTNHKPVKTTPASASKTATTSETIHASTPVNPYQGWQSFTSKLEKITLKYPTGWTASDGGISAILNNTSQEENFSVQSPNETLASGKTIFAEISFSVATSGETVGSCNGLPIYATQDVTINNKPMTIVTLNSFTDQSNPIGIFVTDAIGLKPGGTSANCGPSFASKYGNSNVFVRADFVLPPKPGDHADGESTTLTPAEYNQSTLVQQEIKSLESLSY